VTARRSVLSRRVRKTRLPVRTPRLELVLPALPHARELVELLSEPSVARWTLHIPVPYRPRDARAHIRRARLGLRSGVGLSLQIVRRSDRKVIGGVGLHNFDDSNSSAEVGYWVGRPFRRQGYGGEATRAIVRLAFRQLRLHRVEARVFPGNRGSLELLRRLGFRREGLVRDEVRKDGVWRSSLLFSRLAADRSGRARVTSARVRRRP